MAKNNNETLIVALNTSIMLAKQTLDRIIKIEAILKITNEEIPIKDDNFDYRRWLG